MIDQSKFYFKDIVTKLENKEFVPTGHFYSAVPSVETKENFSFPNYPENTLGGITLNEDKQLFLLKTFKRYHDECPFSVDKVEGARYYFNNSAYSYGDAIVLQSMIRNLQPKRYIEVGSGFSSAAVLDTLNDFNIDCSCTFIEPYPELPESLLLKNDNEKVRIVSSGIQDIELQLFQELEEDDILFIDSTHVSKLSSDVNYIIHEILPILNSGVMIHFHDIIWPFEYPEEWVKEGRAWNESYILRAFLQYNSAFEIKFFSTYLYAKHQDWIKMNLPKIAINPGGNIWLRKN